MSQPTTMGHRSPLSMTLLASAFAGTIVLGCDSSDDALKRQNQVVGAPVLDGGVGPNAGPKCVDVGAAYVGFAGTKLEEGRVNAAIGDDRARIKPYSALKGEYERTIGVDPSSLEQAAASFGTPPDRFAIEPRSNSIQLFSAFRVAFDGCQTYTENGPEFAAAPAPDTASTQCTNMARKFWSRAPTADEVQQCTQVALVDSAAEPAPRRRWAYTCATLLSSAGFLTY